LTFLKNHLVTIQGRAFGQEKTIVSIRGSIPLKDDAVITRKGMMVTNPTAERKIILKISKLIRLFDTLVEITAPPDKLFTYIIVLQILLILTALFMICQLKFRKIVNVLRNLYKFKIWVFSPVCG
jgi:hypothetical protein